MLARSLGSDKAIEAVNVAAEQVGVGETVDFEQALQVLEQVAHQPGIVGIAARFAKSRVHLVWNGD
jgi:hypothetical protein